MKRASGPRDGPLRRIGQPWGDELGCSRWGGRGERGVRPSASTGAGAVQAIPTQRKGVPRRSEGRAGTGVQHRVQDLAASRAALASDLLIEAGSVLASSLDPSATMRQVAELAVPRLADL